MTIVTLFFVSLFALTALVILKMFEEKRGAPIARELRGRADRAVLRTVVRAEQGLHAFVQVFSRKVIIGSLRGLAMALITLLHAIEEKIAAGMSLLRGRSGTRNVKQPPTYIPVDRIDERK